MFKKAVTVFIAAIVLASSIPIATYAATTPTPATCPTDFYADSAITYYSKCAKEPCISSATGGSPIGGPLPAATLQQIKAINLDGMLAKTKERYVYGEQQTGVPWQMLAAIHYREATMNPALSMFDGSRLGGISADGFQTGSSGNDDAKRAAELLIKNAKGVYGVDITKDRSLAGIANAFLAYNRGSMYKSAGATYNVSPYVMNGYDDAHMNMTWVHADSYDGAKKLNNLEGTRDGSLGALTIYSYLTGQGANATGATDSSGCSSGAVTSGTCSVTQPFYGRSGGNGHQLTRAELTSQYGEPGTQEAAGTLDSVDFLGKTVKVHKKVSGCLQAVANEIKTKNLQYQIKDIGGWRADVGGGNVADGSSYHQYGAAVDINATDNPCCSVGSYTMPQAYIDAFRNHGWSWGGDWSSLKDYMHFEYNGPMQ